MNLMSHFVTQSLSVPPPQAPAKRHTDRPPNKIVGTSVHKWCRGCDTYKQIGLFNKSRSNADGHMGYCRICTCSMQTERRRRLAER